MGMANCKPVSTPTCAEAEYNENMKLKSGLLSEKEATLYRGFAARSNHLAPDRTDVQFVAKDAAKHMSKPAALNWAKFKRVARYLAVAPRYL